MKVDIENSNSNNILIKFEDNIDGINFIFEEIPENNKFSTWNLFTNFGLKIKSKQDRIIFSLLDFPTKISIINKAKRIIYNKLFNKEEDDLYHDWLIENQIKCLENGDREIIHIGYYGDKRI